MQRFSFIIQDIDKPNWQNDLPDFKSVDLQVWLIDVGANQYYNDLIKLLNDDEMQRLNRFKKSDDKIRFVYGRGAIRLLCASYLKQNPETIILTESITKKPCIEICFGNLFFNLSHSGNKILIGFSSQNEIGVDIEQIRPDFKTNDFMDRNYALNEITEVNLNSDPLSCFFKFWSRKEAWLKAVGIGVFANLKAIDTSGKNIHIQTEQYVAGSFMDRFNFYTFPTENYWASVVVNNYDNKPEFFQIDIGALLNIHYKQKISIK
jgi:4'-phosphopantetheinyl transferase